VKESIGKMETYWVPSPYLMINCESKGCNGSVIITTYSCTSSGIGGENLRNVVERLCKKILMEEVIIIPNKEVCERCYVGNKPNNYQEKDEF